MVRLLLLIYFGWLLLFGVAVYLLLLVLWSLLFPVGLGDSLRFGRAVLLVSFILCCLINVGVV